MCSYLSRSEKKMFYCNKCAVYGFRLRHLQASGGQNATAFNKILTQIQEEPNNVTIRIWYYILMFSDCRLKSEFPIVNSLFCNVIHQHFPYFYLYVIKSQYNIYLTFIIQITVIFKTVTTHEDFGRMIFTFTFCGTQHKIN